MTESSSTIAVPTGGDPGPPRQRRLIASLGLVAMGVYVCLSGVPGVLVAVQLQRIDPGAKEANLALVAALGALTAVVTTPVWGAVSDRTRSRLGRRAPIVIVGSVLVAAALAVLATATSVRLVVVGMCALQLGFAAVQAALIAVLPDRIGVAARGVASSVLGFGIMLGALVGQVLGASLASVDVQLAYLASGLIFAAAVVVFLVLNPDAPSTAQPTEPLRPMVLLRSFWVSPRRHPDFAWAFAGRAAMMLGFAAVNTYGLYILQGYVGLSEADALGTVSLLAVASFLGIASSILVSGWASDRTGRRKPFVIASAVLAAGASIIPLAAPTVTGMVVFSVVSGIAYGCYLAVDNALITLVLPSSGDAAKDLGVANIASAGAQVVAPAVAGAVVAGFGVYPPLFVISIVMSLLGAVLVLPIRGVR